MEKTLILCFSVFLQLCFAILAIYAYAQDTTHVYLIYLKDGTIIETSSYTKNDKTINFQVNGLPGFFNFKLDQVAKVLSMETGDVYDKLTQVAIKEMQSWDPKNAWIDKKQNEMVIKLNRPQITKESYTLMVKASLTELVYAIPNGWSNIERILITNHDETQGYIFKGGKDLLDNLTKIPMNETDQFIISNSIAWGNINSLKPLKTISMPFNRALAGEYWYITDSNVALMSSPSIPSDKQSFKKEMIIILEPNTKIKIIKSKDSWKEVFIINEVSNKHILRGMDIRINC